MQFWPLWELVEIQSSPDSSSWIEANCTLWTQCGMQLMFAYLFLQYSIIIIIRILCMKVCLYVCCNLHSQTSMPLSLLTIISRPALLINSFNVWKKTCNLVFLLLFPISHNFIYFLSTWFLLLFLFVQNCSISTGIFLIWKEFNSAGWWNKSFICSDFPLRSFWLWTDLIIK